MKKIVPIFLLSLITVSCTRTIIPPVQRAKSIHLSLGNPTDARTDTQEEDNYLLVKPEYALSYDESKGHANWVSWEMSARWLGDADRQDSFRPDMDLPDEWEKVSPSDYTNSGFDRGHLCPSADRTASEQNNSSTFLMTNIIPQAPELNREPWARLEAYSRSLVDKGYRLFIIAGAYGTGGEGSKGRVNQLASGIDVPAHNYKVIVAVANDGGAEQIDGNTPVIAVDFPNVGYLVNNKSWGTFVTTPAAIEAAAGITFFTNLPSEVRAKLRTVRFDPMSTSF